MNTNLTKTQLSLEEKLKNTVVPKEIVDKISKKEIGKTARGIIFDFLSAGIFEKILSAAENIEEATQEYKKGLLMEAFMKQSNTNEKDIKMLEAFVVSPEGNILFNKVIRIVNSNPENIYYIEMLAKVLRNLTSSDFVKMFSKSMYALNQIEGLTPQALIVLMDYSNWPIFTLRKYQSRDGIVTSDWVKEFLPYYMSNMGVKDDAKSRRIAHALRELHRNGFVQSRLSGQGDAKDVTGTLNTSSNSVVCEATELGKEIIDYIDLQTD